MSTPAKAERATHSLGPILFAVGPVLVASLSEQLATFPNIVNG